MTEVSVRELKNKLAEYLRRAEAGEEIAVTRRGKRVVVLSEATGSTEKAKTLDERLQDLKQRGILSQVGKKFTPPARGIPLRGKGPSASEMVIRDRR